MNDCWYIMLLQFNSNRIYMKNLLRKVSRLAFFIVFILFVVGTFAFAILFIIKLNQYNDLNGLYSQAQDNLNKSSTDSKATIGNLQQSFNDLNTEVTSLKAENQGLKNQLDKQSKEGYGEIDGKISGQIILGNDNLSQYQFVCAQNVSNASLFYCLSVSSITQNYALIVPAGTYQVYAKVLGKDNQVALPDYKGVYSEFVKCVIEKGAAACDTALSGKVVNVEIKPSQKISDINPVDWVK